MTLYSQVRLVVSLIYYKHMTIFTILENLLPMKQLPTCSSRLIYPKQH